jgi:hypothetical protein
MYNKKAQISEGITWIVATIAILIILLFSLFLTSFVLKNKQISSDFFSDTINQKSFLSYLLTSGDDGGIIYSKINADGNLNNFNGNLAMKIFNGLYKDKYSEIWIGVSRLTTGVFGATSKSGIDNSFFGSKPPSIVSGHYGSAALKESFSSTLPLRKDGDYQLFTEAIFTKKGAK